LLAAVLTVDTADKIFDIRVEKVESVEIIPLTLTAAVVWELYIRTERIET
jgi:hypothetical protein